MMCHCATIADLSIFKLSFLRLKLAMTVALNIKLEKNIFSEYNATR